MTINLKAPELRELKPRIMVCGVGGAGGNAVNNMITSGLSGVDFIVANTDAQALTSSKADRIIQMGMQVTEGLGAGAQPEVGREAAEEAMGEIQDHFAGVHMVFVTAGMGGGTGTGAAPVIARAAREKGILTVGVVTKPFQFEGMRRMRIAEAGITELQKSVDTLIVIPNQNLFRVANEKTTFADAFSMADQVLYSGVACITDLMVKEGLINLDFADVRAIMREMGKAMMGTGEATGERRAILAAEAAIANPLLDETSMRGARGLLISITGGNDLTLYEVDEAASRIRQEVDEEANIILGATFDESLDGIVRVSVVATGIDTPAKQVNAAEGRIADAAERMRAQAGLNQRPTIAFQGAPAAPIAPAPTPPAEPVGTPNYAEPAAPQPPMQHAPSYAPAPAPLGQQDVQIEPTIRRPPAYAPAPAQDESHSHHEAGHFVPPPAERVMRGPRMPAPEDLPLPGQAQLAARRGEGVAEHQPEQKRRSLLDRIGASLGVRSAPDEQPQAPAQTQARPRAPMAPSAPMAAPIPAPRPAPQLPQGQHADYARRPQAQLPPTARQQQLDLHGRVAPTRSIEDDHLEIPAFLRRQSS